MSGAPDPTAPVREFVYLGRRCVVRQEVSGALFIEVRALESGALVVGNRLSAGLGVEDAERELRALVRALEPVRRD